MLHVGDLVVGYSLTGSTVARVLAHVGPDVVVVERRPHSDVTVPDYPHHSGIRVYTSGPITSGLRRRAFGSL